MKKKLDIFWTFFIIGLTTFGGGYGMLAVMRDKLVNKKKWLSDEEMLELLGISEASPGPFAVNAATFIGFKRAKVMGAFLATLGVILPALIISVLIAIFLKATSGNVYLNGVLKGISAGVSVIILLAFLGIRRKVEYSILNLIVFLIAAALVFFNLVPVYVIIIFGAITGIIIGIAKETRKEDENGS